MITLMSIAIARLSDQGLHVHARAHDDDDEVDNGSGFSFAGENKNSISNNPFSSKHRVKYKDFGSTTITYGT